MPKLNPGPKPGYVQTAEHVDKRKRWGEDHHAWKGSEVDAQQGRKRALRRFELSACERCGKPGNDRHHRDGNPINNEASNIESLCRSCHVKHHRAAARD